MNLADYLEKWGRAIFETPVATPRRADEPPELAEIRLAILDEVRGKSYRSGGKRVFPFDIVRVQVRGVEENRLGVFTGRFFHQYLEREVRGALEHTDCRYPESLRLEVTASARLPGPGEPWLTVESAAADVSEKTAGARLVVTEGTANVTELRITKSRVNIGRDVDVYRSEGLFRRNDLAFAAETEINGSVSREHAHIIFDKGSREYRLFNDRWYNREGESSGIWIVRDGMSQPVHRNARGTKLENGDEIHFGRAVVMFEM